MKALSRLLMGLMLLPLVVACSPPRDDATDLAVLDDHSATTRDDGGTVADADGVTGQSSGTMSTPSIQQLATARVHAIGTATAGAPATEMARGDRDAEYHADVLEEIEDVVRSMFAAATVEREVELYDVVVRRMSTAELSRLRNSPTPEPDTYARMTGEVWVVGFRTPLSVSEETMLVDNFAELSSIPVEQYQDANGMTAVYYVMSAGRQQEGLSYTAIARGILPAFGATWTLEELSDLPE